jgi:hypothetical protein
MHIAWSAVNAWAGSQGRSRLRDTGDLEDYAKATGAERVLQLGNFALSSIGAARARFGNVIVCAGRILGPRCGELVG